MNEVEASPCPNLPPEFNVCSEQDIAVYNGCNLPITQCTKLPSSALNTMDKNTPPQGASTHYQAPTSAGESSCQNPTSTSNQPPRHTYDRIYSYHTSPHYQALQKSSASSTPRVQKPSPSLTLLPYLQPHTTLLSPPKKSQWKNSSPGLLHTPTRHSSTSQTALFSSRLQQLRCRYSVCWG